MEIRFHLDEQVVKAVAVGLRLHGIDATTPADTELLGASDDAQLEFARSQDRVFVTHDRDFLRLNAAGKEHRGIAYCHQDKLSVGELIRALLVMHGSMTAEELHGAVVFL